MTAIGNNKVVDIPNYMEICSLFNICVCDIKTASALYIELVTERITPLSPSIVHKSISDL